MIAIVSSAIADEILDAMKRSADGSGASIIGDVKPEPKGIVAMATCFGGSRMVDMLAGEELPRIC